MKTMTPVNYSLFQAMMEKLPTAVLLLDMEDNLVYSNPSFLLFSRLNAAQASNKGWLLCMHPNAKETLLQMLSGMKGFETPFSKKILRIFKNIDSNSFTTVSITTIKDASLGTLFQLTFVPSDQKKHAHQWNVSNRNFEDHQPDSEPQISEIILDESDQPQSIKQLTQDLSVQTDYINELKASNELKDKVLSVISHDLRSPIASLKNLSTTFFDQALSSDDRSAVSKSLLAQLENVSDLTENLLRWASMSFWKKESAEPEIINVFEIVEQNIALTRQHTQSKNITIVNEVPLNLKSWANKDQIEIVIRNLISNAVKYTLTDGKIHISGADLQTHVQLRIADTGIGLTTEQLCNLFTNSHNNTYGTNGEKGLGLGLLLCKEYLEYNGGKILITSELNIGTTVIVELPLLNNEQHNSSYTLKKLESS